jgi:hypothetical protein
MSPDDKESPNKESNGSDASIPHNRIEQSEKVEQAIQEKELSKKKLHIVWRRGKVLEMLADGETNQSRIAEELKVTEGLISQDISALKEQAKERIRLHLEERLPFAFETCLTRLEKTKREAVDIYNKSDAPRIKLQALTLINDTAIKILDLVTHNDTVLTAMNITNRVEKKLDLLKQDAALEQEERKDKEQNSEVVTVVSDSSNDTEGLEDDTAGEGRESEADSTGDRTTEEDSRVF